MFKVLNVLPVGDKLAVTFEGSCDKIKNGSKLVDNVGNIIEIISVGMVRYENANDLTNSTTVMIDKCDINVGSKLDIA